MSKEDSIYEGMNEEELDRFLDKIKTEYKDGWTEDNWEEEIEKHPLFMTKPIDENSGDLPPIIEAIRQIKWDDDGVTPKEKAIKYKEEGNHYFKSQKYKVALLSYHEALKQNFEDNDLYSILYSNCAAAEFHLKNYRTAFKHCVESRKRKTDNIKAIIKGAECCLELNLYDEGIKWCDKGLLLFLTFSYILSNDKFLSQLRSKLEKEKKIYERNKRKKEADSRKKTEIEKKIYELIKQKGIKCQEDDETFDLFDKGCNPQQKVVSIAENGVSLEWPVVFLYPEYGQTDFIQAFHEDSTFAEHLDIMFAETPTWDTSKKYTKASIRIYYENRRKGCLTRVKKSSSLLEALKSDGYIIQVGTPSFIIMIADSDFEKIYLEKFSSI